MEDTGDRRLELQIRCALILTDERSRSWNQLPGNRPVESVLLETVEFPLIGHSWPGMLSGIQHHSQTINLLGRSIRSDIPYCTNSFWGFLQISYQKQLTLSEGFPGKLGLMGSISKSGHNWGFPASLNQRKSGRVENSIFRD